jgi:hypothetical protein
MIPPRDVKLLTPTVTSILSINDKNCVYRNTVMKQVHLPMTYAHRLIVIRLCLFRLVGLERFEVRTTENIRSPCSVLEIH